MHVRDEGSTSRSMYAAFRRNAHPQATEVRSLAVR